MTKEEYLLLLQGSVSFKELDKETQEKMLKAEGPEMEEYAQMFQEEKQFLNEAFTKMQQANDQVMADFSGQAKAKFMKSMKKKEAKEKKAEDKEAEQILKQI